MGEKEVPIQNIWRTVTEISVTVDVCSGNVKYYILVRGTSEGDKSQSHISSHFAPIEYTLRSQSTESSRQRIVTRIGRRGGQGISTVKY